MEIIKVKRDQVIAKRNGKVKYWYLIQEGFVIQKFGFSQLKLEKNAIIGILEKDIFLCEYVAGEDTTLAGFPCEGVADLKNILMGQEKIRNVFLRTAIEQRHQLLTLYSDLYNKARQYNAFVENVYNDYKIFCGKYKIEQESFSEMDHFKPLQMRHRAEAWEVDNSISIARKYTKEYLQVMEKDDSLTVGVIMEAAAQMRRFTLGIGEMESYLSYNKDILLNESENDLFRRMFDLSIKMYAKKYEIEPVAKDINMIMQMVQKLGIYKERLAVKRWNEFKNYEYDTEASGDANNTRKEIDITTEDCLGDILEFAGYTGDEEEKVRDMVEEYQKTPEAERSGKEAYALRKQLTSLYYDIYYKAFMRAVKDESSLTPVLEMFLNFGFMDVSFVGEEHAAALYHLTAHLDICSSEHVFTIYQWLKRIYSGEKEPSKNEFDLDYPAHLLQMRKDGNLTDKQVEEYKQDNEKKVEFEIQNMFTTVNKITYGKIATFTPILNKNDVLNSIEKMLVTAEKIEDAMNEVRKVDYSVFYREVGFSDAAKGINSEWIMKEVLPDIILMPNAGTRATMWQEVTGVKRDTSARMMFPIFTATELEELMLDVIGCFRWDMCRRIQGVHWNDVRDKSLTSEYCDYLQFYRKNRELSAEAKEKVKNMLTRAQNRYRGVFVKDYINWIKFESKGSFRINRVSRNILIKYCPFSKNIRKELKSNPVYQNGIERFDIETSKKLQRYTALYEKYKKAGGTITPELEENLEFYQM